METMSKLEQELIQRLATLSKCKMVVEEGETIAQLRDELAKAKVELEETKKLCDSYKKELCRALACADKVFQDGLKEPCLLPDYLRLGADKFEAVVTLAKDYLAMQQRAERAEADKCELETVLISLKAESEGNHTAWSECATKLCGISNVVTGDGGASYDYIVSEIKQLTKERDELKAKLEQPRTVMRDGGQLWEVFRGDPDNPVSDDVQEWELESEQWTQPEDELYSHRLYRRPITPDELRSWLPEQQPDAKPVGYIGFQQWEDGHTVGQIKRNSNDMTIAIPVYLQPPQQHGEVLFEGLRKITPINLACMKDELVFCITNEPHESAIPVHVTIRKAGE